MAVIDIIFIFKGMSHHNQRIQLFDGTNITMQYIRGNES